MTEAERENRISADDRKQKIRERYRGVDPDTLDVIPAAPKADIFEPGCRQRVAVYARVSTDDPRQTSSYELQKNYYEDMVNRNPNWDLVDIYADEGISGTSLKHRDAFKRMIEDCRQGKIDLIVTKSVSRFARNIVDCIGYVRQLAAMKPPVGVMFETERIYALDSKSEMSLSFIATLAQEESHNKSEIMNASIEMRKTSTTEHSVLRRHCLYSSTNEPETLSVLKNCIPRKTRSAGNQPSLNPMNLTYFLRQKILPKVLRSNKNSECL